MNRTTLQQRYDTRAPHYDRTIGLIERIALGELRAAFGAALSGQTLEIAIGTGLNLPYYSPAVTRATGVDLSAGMLARAAAQAAGIAFPLALAQADAARLPFPDRAFDTVAISLALCTVPDPAAVLREMSRVCRVDGQLVLLEHVLSPVRPVAFASRLLSPLQERSIGCHLDRSTIDIARAAGIQIETDRARLFGVLRLAIGRPAAI